MKIFTLAPVFLMVFLILSAHFLFAQEAPTSSLGGANFSWNDSIVIEKLLFFEKGREDLPLSQRKYEFQFDQSTTRYIAWELQLKYPAQSKPKPFVIEAVFYDLNEKEIGRLQQEATAEVGKVRSTHSRGWGWPEAGYWTPGRYRVAFFVSKRLLGEKSFEIIRPVVALSRYEWLQELHFDYLRFYEKGAASLPYNKRVYRSWFEQTAARYIAWELHLRHPAAEQDMELRLQAVFYFPDGRIFGRDELNTRIMSGWPTSWHTGGWGWPKAGYWQKGIYKVEFLLEGRLIATDFFEIR